MKAIVVPYIRVYFDRASSLCCIDTGKGTQALRYKTIRFNGSLTSESAPVQDDSVRPRFWFSATNAILLLHEDGHTVEISTVEVPRCKKANNGDINRIVTNAQVAV
jgi:hypothetical protein